MANSRRETQGKHRRERARQDRQAAKEADRRARSAKRKEGGSEPAAPVVYQTAWEMTGDVGPAAATSEVKP